MKVRLAELSAWYDARAATLDALDPHADPGTYWRHVSANVVLNLAEPAPEDVALDLGCGTGNVARTLAPHVRAVTGLDCSPAMLALARSGAPANCAWRLGDLRELPALPGLSLITSCWSLHHLDPAELSAIWRAAWRALPPGGQLVVGELFYSIKAEDIDGIEGWQDPTNSFTHDAWAILRELEDLGFQAVLKPLHPAVSVLSALRR